MSFFLLILTALFHINTINKFNIYNQIIPIGKSNYFTGMSLLIVYCSLVVTFWFLGESILAEADNGLMSEVCFVVFVGIIAVVISFSEQLFLLSYFIY